MATLRRTAWTNWPVPMDMESPSPETPMLMSWRLAREAPVAMEGMRPWTLLKPQPWLMK